MRPRLEGEAKNVKPDKASNHDISARLKMYVEQAITPRLAPEKCLESNTIPSSVAEISLFRFPPARFICSPGRRDQSIPWFFSLHSTSV